MLRLSTNILPLRVYSSLRRRLLLNVNNAVTRHCHSLSNSEDDEVRTIKSQLYPDYKVIYSFPYIEVCNLMQKTKRRSTIFAAALVPICLAGHFMGLVTSATTLNFLISGTIFVAWIHLCLFGFNNVVGYVYYKKNEQKVIVSYVDYWGERVDLKIPVSQIMPFSEMPQNILRKYYRKLIIESCKPKPKLITRYGKIHGTMDFEYLFDNIKK